MDDIAVRQRILELSLQRFLAAGFRGVRTDEIAVAAGISKKTLYRLFRDKRQILWEAVRMHLSRIDADLSRVFDGSDAAFPVQFLSLLNTIKNYLTPVGTPLLEDLVRSVPEIWDELENFRSTRVFPRFEAMIRQGINDGHFRPEIDPKLFTRILIDVIQTVATPRKITAYETSISTVFRYVQIIFFEGILTESGRTRMEAANALRP